ncbi:regulator of cell cycle RGCC [Electrophorus electricus]|uniref:regulator of cell cycle RGCC n=1 Tax=Electrophorus electricus TaxID=8005 RepID=UPI0015CF9B32|nr:regulator of cell cycle RGCC [Electrophorus electricus]
MSTTNVADFEMELRDLLQEFNEVVEELAAPSQSMPYAFEEQLSAAKQRSALNDGVSDSGIEDADDGSEASHGNILNASMEELNTASMTAAQKAAKLGDTSELQSFIENLDKEISEM